jgi:S-adenosylmethionine synthetase
MDVCEAVIATLAAAYASLQRDDPRWIGAWRDIEVLINPNGPMVEAGSDGDNGQTGRKLVMDFYGPRVPIGGGALFGKHYTHIDRLGAMLARRAAIDAVKSGARECLIRVCYAPNHPRPIAIDYEMDGSGDRKSAEFFDHAGAIANAGGTIAIA